MHKGYARQKTTETRGITQRFVMNCITETLSKKMIEKYAVPIKVDADKEKEVKIGERIFLAGSILFKMYFRYLKYTKIPSTEKHDKTKPDEKRAYGEKIRIIATAENRDVMEE